MHYISSRLSLYIYLIVAHRSDCRMSSLPHHCEFPGMLCVVITIIKETHQLKWPTLKYLIDRTCQTSTTPRQVNQRTDITDIMLHVPL